MMEFKFLGDRYSGSAVSDGDSFTVHGEGGKFLSIRRKSEDDWVYLVLGGEGELTDERAILPVETDVWVILQAARKGTATLSGTDFMVCDTVVAWRSRAPTWLRGQNDNLVTVPGETQEQEVVTNCPWGFLEAVAVSAPSS